ncbi:hypothetical protein [Corynebacterium macclintockiae]|uniref:hypothetical protein n=1 Tax=Corynebacterium macclintockiae TaxID=2913501 RepID=UPI003EBBCE2C
MSIQSAEKVALDILRTTGVPTHVTPPRDVAAPYYRVARVGGTMENIVTDAALIAISAYAADPAVAADLANQAREVMLAARASRVGGAWVRWWSEASGPSHYPDPTSKLFRYQFTGQLNISTNLD